LKTENDANRPRDYIYCVFIHLFMLRLVSRASVQLFVSDYTPNMKSPRYLVEDNVVESE